MCLSCCFCEYNWQTFWTAIGAIGVTAGLVYTGHQIRLRVWINLQQIFTKDEFTKARSNVCNKLLDISLSSITDKDIIDLKKDIKEVCRRMDEFCHLGRYFSEDKILRYWGNPIGKAWGLLQEFVTWERERTRWPKKWEAFEDMGRKCLAKFTPEVITEYDFNNKAEKIRKILQAISPPNH